MEKMGESIKKLLLAGIGTAAVTAERSKEILDELVKKGELTVEQGRVLNQELKHNIKETLKDNVKAPVKASTPEELKDLLENMTSEQLAALKEQIAELENNEADEDEILDDADLTAEEE